MPVGAALLQVRLARFARHAQEDAAALLARLAPDLDPQLTLLVAPLSPCPETLPQLIPPRAPLEASWFQDAQAIARSLAQESLHPMTPDVTRRLWHEKVNFRTAVQNSLDWHSARLDRTCIVTFPERVQGHLVCIMLDLAARPLQRYYALPRQTIRPYAAKTSLLHEVIAVFLHRATLPLKRLMQGYGGPVLRAHGDEALREAGFWLMHAPQKASRHLAHESLFHACNVISSLRYEGCEGQGRLLIVPPDHPQVEVAVRLQAPLTLTNYRGIRKLLEVTTPHLSLLADGAALYGIGHPRDASEPPPWFAIEFSHPHSWKLLHAGHEMMIVRYGQPSLPRTHKREQLFHHKAAQLFPQSDEATRAYLWRLIAAAAKQPQGTMLVLSEGAAAEATRLRHQSTLIEPLRLTPELMIPLSSIDGAILATPDGTCHAIGVILDGPPSERGDPARGARYNSAIRYSEYAARDGHACLTIVISEDGMIDLV